jgi:histone deacetylase complex regulatory component SIN3
MTVKQAEKWLEKVRNSNSNSFKELSKILKKYEKHTDDYECFVKVNTLLLDHPDLTAEINGFLEEGNKFIVNQSEV